MVTPPPVDSNSILRVVAIDPGITQTGWAVLDYNVNTSSVIVIASGTLKGDELFRRRKEMKPYFMKSFCTLDAYREEFVELLTLYRPDYVTCEGAFHYKFVNALISLTLVTHTLRSACAAVLKRDLHIVAPMQTKKAVINNVTKNDMANKDIIKSSILAKSHVAFDPSCRDRDVMTEHEYDAIAHGLCFCQIIYPNLTLESRAVKP